MTDTTAYPLDTHAQPTYNELGYQGEKSLSSTSPITRQPRSYDPRTWLRKLMRDDIDADLPFPGTNDMFGKEAKMTLANNFLFDGAKAELNKSISMAPQFQINHTFALGGMSPGSPAPAPGSYNFAAVVVNDDVLIPRDQAFLQASIEGSGGLFGVLKYGWGPRMNDHMSKIQCQLPPSGSMSGMPAQFIFDHEIKGSGYATSFSFANPSPIDFSGVYGLNHLQSLTTKLAAGFSAQFVNFPSRPEICGVSLSPKLKYTNRITPLQNTAGDSILTLELPAAQQGIQASYWQYLGERVEAGAELTVGPDMEKPGSGVKQGLATVGLKFDYRMATYRGQVSSDGKISAHLEQRLNPLMSLQLCGEIDQLRNTSKFGVGISLEGTSPDDMARMSELAQAKQQARLP